MRRHAAPLRHISSSALGLGLVLLCPNLWAQIADSANAEAPLPEEPTERRGGFFASLTLGNGTGQIHGYPNKLQEIGKPESRVEFSSPLLSGLQLYLGGTATDWFTASVGLSLTSGKQEENLVGLGLIGIRLETFPLFYSGGTFRDLGVFGTFGAGFGSAVPEKERSTILADGGSLRGIELGAFWEPLHLWHFSFGPELKYQHLSSDSMAANVVTLGFRSTFYGTQL